MVSNKNICEQALGPGFKSQDTQRGSSKLTLPSCPDFHTQRGQVRGEREKRRNEGRKRVREGETENTESPGALAQELPC